MLNLQHHLVVAPLGLIVGSVRLSFLILCINLNIEKKTQLSSRKAIVAFLLILMGRFFIIVRLMADYAVFARDLGVKIIGGCCGTSPEHVRAMAQVLNQTPSASPATLAEIEAKFGKPWKDLPDSAEDGQSRRRCRRRRG